METRLTTTTARLEHVDLTVADAGSQINGLNHVAVVVDDLDAMEGRVRSLGLEPFNFGDDEPGRRFYVLDPDSVEYEMVSYAT